VNKTPTIVYMGSPDFAVPTLHALHASPFDLLQVVTQPDRPRGRGRRQTSTPVKAAASAYGYEIAQPENVRSAEFIDALTSLSPDYLVVVAFGQILPATVLQVPRYGAINVHASLLPKYRGPAPIQWAILRGETITGVTTLLMDTGVDTGDLLLSAETAIASGDTAASLHDRLSSMGARLLIETIQGMRAGTLFPRAQNHKEATYAPLLRKEFGRIQWMNSATAIEAQIRAMTPWPGAYCMRHNKPYKIHRAIALPQPHPSAPGTVVAGFPDELRIATGEGQLSILEIQGASGKRLPIHQFLHGNPIPPGEVFD
jgi:methionyl-tRNA formyltransferase